MRITSLDANLLIISNKEIKYLQFNAIFCGLCFNISLMLTFFWGIAYVICLLHFMESTIALVCTKITSWQTEFYMHLKTFSQGYVCKKFKGYYSAGETEDPTPAPGCQEGMIDTSPATIA